MIPRRAWGLLPALLLVGCAASGGRTDGLALRLEREAPGGAHVAYRLDADGVLAFAGGRDVTERRWSWSRPLTDAELAELRRIVDEAGGYATLEPAREPAEGVRVELEVRDSGVRRRHEVDGDPPALRPLLALLEATAAERHRAILDRLPQAGDPVP